MIFHHIQVRQDKERTPKRIPPTDENRIPIQVIVAVLQVNMNLSLNLLVNEDGWQTHHNSHQSFLYS